jgi:hypothetical protein
LTLSLEAEDLKLDRSEQIDVGSYSAAAATPESDLDDRRASLWSLPSLPRRSPRFPSPGNPRASCPPLRRRL